MNPDLQNSTNAYRLLAVLCACSVVVLFLFRSVELSGMSVSFAGSVANGDWYFFPHHLLFQPVIHLFAIVLGPVGCDAVCAGQVHSILWALVVIAASYLIVLWSTRSLLAALATGALLFFSHDVWVFASQVEPYIPVIGMNALIAAIVLRNGADAWRTGTTVAVTAIFTFSLFFHQSNVFFLIPLAAYLALAQGRAGLWTVAKIAVVAAVISVGLYVLVFVTTEPDASVRSFYLWLTHYAVVSDDSHGAWEAFYTLDLQRLKETARAVVAMLVTEPSDALRAPARLVITALLLLAILANILFIVRRRPGSDVRIFLIVWAATFLAFFSWWQSGVHKFFLFSVMPIMILCTLALTDLLAALSAGPSYRRAAAFAALLAMGAMAFINFDRSIRPMTGQGSGIAGISGKLARSAPPECVLYTKRRFAGYLSHFHELKGFEDYRLYQIMYKKLHFSRFSRDLEEVSQVSTDVSEDECNVILLDWLAHEDFQWKGGRGLRRTSDVAGADTEQPNWPAFISWMLDVQPAPDGPGIVHDEFVIFRGEDDEAFVRIDRRRSAQAESLDALLDVIDQAVRSDPRNAFTRSEHRKLNQFRTRVFGYS